MSSDCQHADVGDQANATMSRAASRDFLWLVTIFIAFLQGCSSGSTGSDVGDATGVAPTARVEILNGGTTGTFREGAEVLLTGKASEDGDGPLIRWTWTQTAGLPIEFREVNSATIGFTAPAVSAPEELTFELTVLDSTGDTGRATIDVTVVPARDGDKFLSLDVRSGSTFDGFRVVAALGAGAVTGSFPKPFTLSAQAHVVYPPRSAPSADCKFDSNDFSAGVPSKTASGCLIELLEDLTPAPLTAGGTGIEGEWPANVVAPVESEESRIARWWNPRFSLKIPRIVVRDLNQRFIDSNQRDRMLDGYAAQSARIVIALSLAAPANQGDATLVLTDRTDLPISLAGWITTAAGVPIKSNTIENAGGGLPTTAVVPLEALLASIQGRESKLTAEVYYRTVDPDSKRTTLNAWLKQAGFAPDDSGTLLPVAIDGTGEFAHAVYMNNFDLGFGRQMFSRTDEFGNVFSFVKNYRTLEGAVRDIDSFATVVMEYSPLRNHQDSSPKFVKFFTYVDDGSGDEQLVSSFDFDSRGERYTPGNCVACHGGAKPPDVESLVFDEVCGNRTEAMCYTWPIVNQFGENIADGDLDATFLPWDLDSLLFVDTDPAITEAPLRFDGISLLQELSRDYGDFSRQSQESQLKKLNQAAYDTYDDASRFKVVREIVEHWYGGVDPEGKLIGAYDDSSPRAGWRNGELVEDPEDPSVLLTNPMSAADIHSSVYSRHCRMCHSVLLDDSLRMDTYQTFMGLEPFRGVFLTGIMPGARLTMDRLWSPFSDGPVPGTVFGEHLAEALAVEQPTPPGDSIAVIAGLDPPSNRSDTVYLSGSPSVLADEFLWRLTLPDGSNGELIGAQTEQPMFVVAEPGTYEVTLTVNEGRATEHTVTQSFDATNRAPQAANDVFELDLLQSAVLSASVFQGSHQDSDPDGDRLMATVTPNGSPAEGNVLLHADGSFIYTYTGDPLSAPANDSFRYTIVDGYGGTDEGIATILLNKSPSAERPSPAALLDVVDASTELGDESAFAVQLDWTAASDDTQVAGYRLYRNGEFLEFLPGTEPPGTVVTYVDKSVEPDKLYTYHVTASDDVGNESRLSESGSVRVVTSLRRNIQTGWGTGTDSLWKVSGCIGCHRGAPGGLTLRGSADQVFSEVMESGVNPAAFRIDRASPQDSLILCKPLIVTNPNGCAHGGGDFLVTSRSAYQTLLRWIESGAPDN